jgi:hypothetical protein
MIDTTSRQIAPARGNVIVENRISKYLMAPTTKSFPELQRRLNDLGISAAELSRILGIEQSRISQFLAGELPATATAVARKFCDGIGIDVGAFLRRQIKVLPTFDASTLQTLEAKLAVIMASKEQARFIRSAIDLAYAQAVRSRDSG